MTINLADVDIYMTCCMFFFITGWQVVITRLQGHVRQYNQSFAKRPSNIVVFCHFPSICRTVHGKLVFQLYDCQ